MRLIARALSYACVGAVLAIAPSSAFADKIVLANDEWHTSNTGFALSPAGSTANFALNVASFFTGGGAGSFLVVSDNFSLDPAAATSFTSTLTGAGHTVVDSQSVPGFTFDLATLQGYDAAFLALPPSVDQGVLTSYVNGGGNVYINAGTGIGGAAAEAANWNTFLNAFGMNLASNYNGIGGVIPIVSASPIMSGVSALYQNNGNTISLTGSTPNAQIIASLSGQGLYAVYDDSATTIPEPASMALLGTGLLWFAARRRARS